MLLDVIPPSALLLLNVSILITLRGRLGQVPYPRLATVCVVAPAVYAIGMLLYLIGGKWHPGVAFGALGTLAVPTALAITLHRNRAARVSCVAAAFVAWAAVWPLAPLHPEGWTLHTSELVYAGFIALTIVVAATGLRIDLARGEAGGLQRRIFVLCLPFLLIGLVYLLVEQANAARKPVFSTCVHVAAEILLLMLVSQSPEEEELPSTLPAMMLQVLLLAVGALLLLVLAANLRIFPKEAGPLVVAALVATGLALGYGAMRPTLDLLLKNALYPEAHQAEQRLLTLQTELDSARDRLRQAEHLSLVGQLAAQVAHEIKNPLGPIKGYTKIIERETLKAGALSEKVQRGIEIIRQEVEAIDSRARGLLELARPPQPHTEDVDFVALGQDVIDLVSSDLPSGVRLVWGERPQAAPGRADPLLIRSALTNVVQNGIQVMGPGGGAITLSLQSNGDGWRLFVDDEGPGIPTEDPEELFRPFVSHREGGSGLGLVISRGSMRAMGGDLSLESREGGARAVFRLPSPTGTTAPDSEQPPAEPEEPSA